MNGKPAYTLVPPSPRVRAVDDGWGLFDPNKAGLKAAIRAVQPMETPTDDAIELESVDRDDVLEMIFPDDLPAPDSAPHETTVRDLAPPQPGRGPARLVSQGPSNDEGVYDLTEVEQSTPRHKPADKGAVYTLEFPDAMPAVLLGNQRRSRLAPAADPGVVHVDAAAQGLHHRVSRVRRHSVGRAVRTDLIRHRTRMEFQEYAAQEVSALIDRLVSDAEARTEAVLTGSQREHDAALSSLRAQLEARGRELAERTRQTEQLTAAEEETRRQLAVVHTEAEAQLADAQRREAELQRRFVAAAKTAERELTDARAALEAAEGEMQRLETEHQQSLATINAVAEQEIADARSALDAAREEARRVETELQKGLTAASAAAEKELAAARASLDAARAETHRLEEEHQRKLAAVSAAAEKELATARKALDAARADAHASRRRTRRTPASASAAQELAAAHDAAEQELQDARAALEAAQAEAQRLTRQFDSALEELRQEHVNTLHQQAVARTALPLDELLAVFGSLASASTPSAVLTTVVSALGREFSRVALFRVRGGRLECVSHVGFEFEGDVAKVVIPTTVDSLMTRAVNARRTQTFVAASGDESCPVPFGGAPACAVALPLISGDAPVAVVYADDSDQLEFGSVPSELLVKFAELVWQHAILVLQRASAAQKMLAVAPVQSFERLA